MYTRPYLLTQVDDIITAILDIKRHKEKVWVCWCDCGEEERRTGEEVRGGGSMTEVPGYQMIIRS
jgi:hypothetical protein